MADQEQSVEVRIVGVGINKSVKITELEPNVQQALAEGQVEAERDGLVVKVNGETVEDPAAVAVNDGDTIIVVPPAVKLG